LCSESLAADEGDAEGEGRRRGQAQRRDERGHVTSSSTLGQQNCRGSQLRRVGATATTFPMASSMEATAIA